MMVGLPACGKTTWASKHTESHPEKKYNTLGTNAIMEKMKVMGLRRQKNYAGRWDVLIQQATQCLNRLIQIAARKRRNYILDQVRYLPLPLDCFLLPVCVCNTALLTSALSLINYLFILQVMLMIE
ncbi:unnamed protein product [Oncorhynchus mykiss]|uniref:Uncharacterized protein n=1 Tax=Oncorhynchus mykiss TaxID=8022 RepID=A0A060YX84_ONCMY|nr:unnamed protein product [Oncorhynchus mykiss]